MKAIYSTFGRVAKSCKSSLPEYFFDISQFKVIYIVVVDSHSKTLDYRHLKVPVFVPRRAVTLARRSF